MCIRDREEQELAREQEDHLWEVENRRAAKEMAAQEKAARQKLREENERSALRRAVTCGKLT